MCQTQLKKLLRTLLLLVVFSSLGSVWASELQNVDPNLFLDNPQEMQQNFKNEYSSSNQTSEIAVLNSNLLSQNLEQQNLESMSALELLNSLEESYNNAEKSLEAAILSSKNSESELLATKAELKSCKEILQNCKAALQSNKEDTHVIAEELGELQEKLDKINDDLALMTKKRNEWRTTTFIATPIALGIGFIFGSFFYYKYGNK